MPFVDLPNEDVSLHYVIPSSSTNLPKLDPEKPTVLFIHPHCGDVTCFEPQFQDKRLASRYNLIAFDGLDHGRTKNKANPEQDVWVLAAAIAKGLDALETGPVYVVASNFYSNGIALFLTILFPRAIRGLLMASDYFSLDRMPLFNKWAAQYDKELKEATSLEEVAHTMAQMVKAVNGSKIPPASIHKQMNKFLQRYIHSASKYTGIHILCLAKYPIPPQVLSSIKCPVSFILPSDPCWWIPNPDKALIDIREAVTQAKDGASVTIIGGGEGNNLAISAPEEFNDILVDWLAEYATTPAPAQKLDWSCAWRKFVSFTGQPFRQKPATIRSQDFCALTPIQRKIMNEKIKSDQEVEAAARKLLGNVYPTSYWDDFVDREHPELTEEICMRVWNEPWELA